MKKQKSDVKFTEIQKQLLWKEVNRGIEDPIDRSVFRQTAEQKQAAWEAKRNWKKENK